MALNTALMEAAPQLGVHSLQPLVGHLFWCYVAYEIPQSQNAVVIWCLQNLSKKPQNINSDPFGNVIVNLQQVKEVGLR